MEGEILFPAGDTTHRAPVDPYVCIPRGVFHNYWNEQATPAMVIAIEIPAGLKQFFAEREALMGAGVTDQATLDALWDSHDMVPPPEGMELKGE